MLQWGFDCTLTKAAVRETKACLGPCNTAAWRRWKPPADQLLPFVHLLTSVSCCRELLIPLVSCVTPHACLQGVRRHLPAPIHLPVAGGARKNHAWKPQVTYQTWSHRPVLMLWRSALTKQHQRERGEGQSWKHILRQLSCHWNTPQGGQRLDRGFWINRRWVGDLGSLKQCSCYRRPLALVYEFKSWLRIIFSKAHLYMPEITPELLVTSDDTTVWRTLKRNVCYFWNSCPDAAAWAILGKQLITYLKQFWEISLNANFSLKKASMTYFDFPCLTIS